jgi:hypothetical protein
MLATNLVHDLRLSLEAHDTHLALLDEERFHLAHERFEYPVDVLARLVAHGNDGDGRAPFRAPSPQDGGAIERLHVLMHQGLEIMLVEARAEGFLVEPVDLLSADSDGISAATDDQGGEGDEHGGRPGDAHGRDPFLQGGTRANGDCCLHGGDGRKTCTPDAVVFSPGESP